MCIYGLSVGLSGLTEVGGVHVTADLSSTQRVGQASRARRLDFFFFLLARVLVLDKGVVAEFDSPVNLIAAGGIFYGMAKDAGLA